MNNLKKVIPLVLLLGLTACTPRVAVEPPTQLEIRAIQTREFDTSSTQLVMKTMMNVLQDEGYIIKNAVLDMGLLSAEKQVSIENKGEAAMLCLLIGPQARWSKNQVLEASANVSEFGEQVRVRINFQIKKFDNFGAVIDVFPVTAPEQYQDFFEKVSKGMFIQKEGI